MVGRTYCLSSEKTQLLHCPVVQLAHLFVKANAFLSWFMRFQTEFFVETSINDFHVSSVPLVSITERIFFLEFADYRTAITLIMWASHLVIFLGCPDCFSSE